MIQNSSYEEYIRLLCKCESYIDEPEYLLDERYFENSEISSYFWDKGFDEAMILANHFEEENKKLSDILKNIKSRYLDEGEYLSMKDNAEIWEMIKEL